MSERLAVARLLLRLAWRSLWRNRRRTEITLSSIALGLSLALFFGSLAQGTYEKAVTDATRLLAGQLTVETPRYNESPGPALALSGAPALRDRLQAMPGVVRVRPLVSAQAVASSGAGSLGVVLIGVDPRIERGSSPLESKLVAGKFLDPSEPRGLLIGAGLAKRLRVAPGKKVVLTATDVQGNVSSELFRVSGIFRLGADELDTYAAQGQLPLVRKLLGLREDQVGQLGLFLAPDGRDVQRKAQELAGPALAVRTWQETMPGLAAWIAIDSRSNDVTRALLIGLVMFTIMNTLLMSVLERGHEFAVLLALGTPPRQLKAQVLLEVVLLAVLGCALGALLGSLAAWWGQVRGIDLSGAFPEGVTVGGMALDPIIHCKLSAFSVAKVTGLVFAATILLGLGPMRRAGRVDVVTSLRTQR